MQRLLIVLFTVLIVLTLSAPLFAQDSLNVSCVNWMRTGGAGVDPAYCNGYLYVTGEEYKGSSSIVGLDIRDFDNVDDVCRKSFPYIDLHLSLAGDDFLVSCYDHGIVTFSLEDPTDPVLMGELELADDETIMCNALYDNTLYLGTSRLKIYSIDLSDLEFPTMRDTVELDGIPNLLRTNGDFLFALNYDMVRINTENPDSMFVTDEIDVRAEGLTLHEDYAILNVLDSGLHFIDCSDSDSMEEDFFYELKTHCEQIFINGDTLFAYHEVWELVDFVDGSPLYNWVPYVECIDISDPSNPSRLVWYKFYTSNGFLNYFQLENRLLTIVSPSNRSNNFDLISQSLTEDNWMKLFSFPLEEDGIVIYRNKLLRGMSYGIWVMNLEDPTTPELDEIIKIDLPVSSLRIVGNYLVAYHHAGYNDPYSFTVFDLSDGFNDYFTYEHPKYLRTPSVSKSGYLYFISSDSLFCMDFRDFDNPEIISTIDIDYGGRTNILNDELIYIPQGIRGLAIVDVSSPENMSLINRIEFEHAPFDFGYIGEIGILAGFDLTVLDLQNPEEPEVIAELEIPNTSHVIGVHDSIAVVSADRMRAEDDEYAGVYIIDFSDYYNPEIVGYYEWWVRGPSAGIEEIAIRPPYIYTTALTSDPIFYCPDYLSAPQPPQLLLPAFSGITAYPNPFNAQTHVSFSLPRTGSFQLNLFDSNGRQLYEITRGSGVQQQLFDIPVDATSLPSGKYILQLNNESEISTYPMTLIK